MLEKLLGVKTLEETEPFELEEVDDSLAPQLPAEYEEHLDNHHEDAWRLDENTNLVVDEEEAPEEALLMAVLEETDGDS